MNFSLPISQLEKRYAEVERLPVNWQSSRPDFITGAVQIITTLLRVWQHTYRCIAIPPKRHALQNHYQNYYRLCRRVYETIGGTFLHTRHSDRLFRTDTYDLQCPIIRDIRLCIKKLKPYTLILKFSKKLLTSWKIFAILSLVLWENQMTSERECWNWQTGKTKDLVSV